MTKMMKGKKKAISPIIATLILIVIAVVAGVMLYGFVTGFMAKTTSNISAFSGSTLVIEGASINGSSTNGYTVEAVVTNTGSSTVTLNAINVLYASNNSLIGTTSSSSSLSKTSIAAGTTETVKGTLSTPLTSTPAHGTPVVVQVVTSSGAYVSYQTTWP
jgi:flagellin-like protein